MPVAQSWLYEKDGSTLTTEVPGVKNGGSSTGVTVIVKVDVGEVGTPPLAFPPESCRAADTSAMPFALGASWNVRSPDAESCGGCWKRPGLLFDSENVSVCVNSSVADAGAGAMELAHIPTVDAGSSSVTAMFVPGVNNGASLTGLILIRKMYGSDSSRPPFAVPPLSCGR